MKLYLGGEGVSDLGDWARPPQYRGEVRVVGMIEALVRKVIEGEFDVVGATIWKDIRKYRAGKHLQAETRNVLGLILRAEDAGCDALAFVRDRDGDASRQTEIEEGLRLRIDMDLTVAVAGGVAIEAIEAWLLGLLGEMGTERHRDPKAVLSTKHGIVTTAQKVESIGACDVGGMARDAASLRAWLAAVRHLIVAETIAE